MKTFANVTTGHVEKISFFELFKDHSFEFNELEFESLTNLD